MSIEECKFIDFPKIEDPRGALSFIENKRHIPFDIQRVYYLYEIHAGASRAGHAHKELEQVLIAVSGSFDVHLDDGKITKKYELKRSDCGLYISSMVWREISNFSSGSVCLALASKPYDEADYIRGYQKFIAEVKS